MHGAMTQSICPGEEAAEEAQMEVTCGRLVPASCRCGLEGFTLHATGTDGNDFAGSLSLRTWGDISASHDNKT